MDDESGTEPDSILPQRMESNSRKRFSISPTGQTPTKLPPPPLLEYLFHHSSENDVAPETPEPQASAAQGTSEQQESISEDSDTTFVTIEKQDLSTREKVESPTMVNKTAKLKSAGRRRLRTLSAKAQAGKLTAYGKCYGCRLEVISKKEEYFKKIQEQHEGKKEKPSIRELEHFMTNTKNDPCMTCGRRFCDNCESQHSHKK